MKKLHQLKIDVFSHVLPVKYKEVLLKEVPTNSYWQRSVTSSPTLFDMERRFSIMDKYEGLMQVLTLGSPAVELFFSPEKSADLARMANDGMAELVLKYPERFVAAVACLPMNNMDAALKEVERAINDLKFRGIQLHTPINDRPLDSPEFLPLYEKMSAYDLPIWIHPYRPEAYADYRTEDSSSYRIFHMFGWPYETSAAMARLVFSGILEKYPNLKFITHHCGGMVPYFDARIVLQQYRQEMRSKKAYAQLTKPPIEYFKKFYADTAVSGSTAALMCGYAFFGADHILFGTDMPYGPQLGDFSTRRTINSIEQMDIGNTDQGKIFESNTRILLRLPI